MYLLAEHTSIVENILVKWTFWGGTKKKSSFFFFVVTLEWICSRKSSEIFLLLSNFFLWLIRNLCVCSIHKKLSFFYVYQADEGLFYPFHSTILTSTMVTIFLPLRNKIFLIFFFNIFHEYEMVQTCRHVETWEKQQFFLSLADNVI